MPLLLVAGAIAAFILFSGPGKPKDEVVLLPGPDGRPSGVVVVEREGERHVLDRSYVASRSGEARVVQRAEKDVRAQFGSVLAALPPRPAKFQLYFVSGTDELTGESKGELAKVLEEMKRRSAPDVAVIAHTDTVGEHEANDRLSAQRAERMKSYLVGIGVPAERIQASGRGERELLVATPDNTDEPRNRRVEINVR
jgi:outer membrane protein OmpA-like peptidoglycan-associated protein